MVRSRQRRILAAWAGLRLTEGAGTNSFLSLQVLFRSRQFAMRLPIVGAGLPANDRVLMSSRAGPAPTGFSFLLFLLPSPFSLLPSLPLGRGGASLMRSS